MSSLEKCLDFVPMFWLGYLWGFFGFLILSCMREVFVFLDINLLSVDLQIFSSI